jgi:uncharacterized iron-regulated membrane protein
MKQQTVKYWIRQLHLWPGLVSGLVVFIVSLTGCLFVFQKELSESIHPKTFFIPHHQRGPSRSAAPLLLSVLLGKAQDNLGKKQPVNYITTYKEADRAWEFMAYKENDTALTYFGAIEYFRSVFIDPYTGKVTGFRDYKYDFFNIVKYLHWSLLLNTRYGQPIVGWSTAVFVILLFTGLILWWPKKWNKAARQRSFSIRWKASHKRVNYDLHNVLGFYSLLLTLVIALTGMEYAFHWFENAVYTVISGKTERQPEVAMSSVKIPGEKITGNGLDKAFTQSQLHCPPADRIGISPPRDTAAPVYISTYRGKEIYYDRDDLQFDQYSGKLLHVQSAATRNKGSQLIEMNYDIHVGAIGGFTGKIIAFIISLICTSLPVSGFLVWWWKRKKRLPYRLP